MGRRGSLEDVLTRAESIVAREWAQFQRVSNEGGRASCQDDWQTFQQMRLSQFLTWPVPLLDAYVEDLDDADATGRNLLTEKYARMMASTEPDRYASELAPFLPHLSDARIAAQEEIIAIQVEWARAFAEQYPRLGAGMRVLRTSQDTVAATSFETYLRGELGTYSDLTLVRYRELVDAARAAGENVTARILTYTVVLAGFADLAEAEAAQAL